jgi:ribosomal protein S15P/S13E
MKWFQFENPAYRVKVLDYTYTSEPSINTALPVQASRTKQALFYLGVLVTLGFLWLLARWSAKRRAIFRTNICLLEHATHFLVRDEDNGGEMTLVERTDKFEMRLRRQCTAFNYHDRNYIYIEEKEVFVPVRYEELGHHLDQLKKDRFLPLSEAKRTRLLDYYGENVMKL